MTDPHRPDAEHTIPPHRVGATGSPSSWGTQPTPPSQWRPEVQAPSIPESPVPPTQPTWNPQGASTWQDQAHQQWAAAAQPSSSPLPPGAPPSAGYPGAAPFTAPQAGIIPFRPLAISDLFEGTFKILRHNPLIMFGISVVVMAVVSIAMALITWWTYVPYDNVLYRSSGMDSGALADLLTRTGITSVASLFMYLLIGFASMLLSAALTIVAADAVIGRSPTLSEVMRRFARRILPLIGLAVLTWLIITAIIIVISIVGFVVGAALVQAWSTPDDYGLSGLGAILLVFIVGLALFGVIVGFIGTRLIYSMIVCILEETGPVESMKRSWQLTSGSFWKTVGRYLLISILVSSAAGIVGAVITTIPSVIVSSTQSFGALQVVITFSSTLITGLTIPVMLSYLVLMYTDERIRRENFADVLTQAAQH